MKYDPKLGMWGNVDKALKAVTEANRKIFNTDSRVASNEEAMKTQLAESDEIAIELYEANLVQESVNAEQDEAIIEIYEMMEGINNG